MSFSNMAKQELAHLKPRKKCCRRAELSALIRMGGSIHLKDGKLSLSVVSRSPATARKILLLMKDQFDIDTELLTRRPGLLKKKIEQIIFVPDQKRLSYALKKMGILDNRSAIEPGVPFDLINSYCCKAAYLRGVFLGGGSISEPTHGHHIEMATANLTLARDILSLLRDLKIDARLHTRKRDHAVYFKEADQIEDFLAMIGAHKTVLDYENMRIIRTFKGQVNRIVNCEAYNLRKSANASIEQIKDIKQIDGTRGISSLPKALREIALLRLSDRSANLRELGEVCNPILSKSAVYHRMRRIHQLAQGPKQ